MTARDLLHHERPPKLPLLQRRLHDGRSMKVAFVSHCLLNQNVRYLGGATDPAGVDTLVNELRGHGVGIVQMPCPEQRAWGGVLKRRMLRLYGSPLARSRVARRLTLAATRCWTRMVYGRLARHVAYDIRDYIAAGYEVTNVIGVGPSPSCGVSTSIDLGGAIEAMGHCNPGTIDVDTVNNVVVRANKIPGRGMFIDAVLDRVAPGIPVREEVVLPEPRRRGS